MKWIKRLLVLLGGLLLGSVLILAGVVLFLGESNYKRLLGWSAEQFLDSQLVIEGPIEVDISRNLSLSSGDILFKANDESYRFSVGNLRVNFRLGSYLQTGTLWFNNIELDDVNLEIIETVKEDDIRIEDFSILSIIVEQAHFSNLEFAYQELPPGSLHKFSLDELTMEELGEQQPVSLRASGQFKEQPFAQYSNAERPEAHTNLGTIHANMQRNDLAQLEFEQVITIDPSFIPAYINLADLYRGRGLDGQGKRYLETAIEKRPDSGSAHHSLGLLYVRQKKLPEALFSLKKAVELEPQNIRYKYVYAVALDSTGGPSKAIKVLKHAHEQRPADCEVLYALISFHQKSGNIEKAKHYTNVLIAVSRWDQNAKALLKKL